MKESSYYYISITYCTIAALSAISLGIKGYLGYLNTRDTYLYDDSSSLKKRRAHSIDYILHILHIPPYLLAAYWYYDSYVEYKDIS